MFSTDHKIIGLQYGFTSMFFLLVGFFLVLLIRWQLAYPGEVVPFGGLLGESNAPGGSLSPEFYNQAGRHNCAGWDTYRMTGVYTIQSQAGYDAFLKEEASYLTNP
jgi:hypothetical protein